MRRTAQNTLMKEEITNDLKPAKRFRLLILLISILFVASVFGISFYYFNAKQSTQPEMNSYLSNVKNWLNQNSQVTSQEAFHPLSTPERADFGQKVHFEFYSTLSQGYRSDGDKGEDFAPMDPPSLLTPKEASVKLVQNNPKKPQSTIKTAAAKLMQRPIIKAEELELDLSHQIKRKSYFLQSGRFSQMTQAELYRKKLLRTGMNTQVIKAKEGKNVVYYVRSVPFSDKQKALLTQKKLQKNGFTPIHILEKIIS